MRTAVVCCSLFACTLISARGRAQSLEEVDSPGAPAAAPAQPAAPPAAPAKPAAPAQPPAPAATPERPPVAEPCVERSTSRSLGGHNFVPMELVAWPFITTYFGFGLGGGVMEQKGVGMDASGNAMTGESVTLAALAQQIRLGIGLFDWVAIRGHFAGSMVSGASLDEILGVGALFQYNVGGGAQVRVIKTSHLMLSLGADFDYSEGKLITPGLAVEAALSSLDLDAATKALLNDVSSWSFTPLLAVGVAPASAIGFQTSFGFAIGSDDVNGASTSTKGIEWGIAATLDLRPFHVPIALPFAYQLEKTFGDQGGTGHQIEAGLFYSGRSNLDLGFALQTRIGDNDSKMYLGLLRMNYLW